MKKVGFQGISGAYSEMAVIKLFAGAEIEILGYHNFEDIFVGVHSGELDFGVVPIENSIAGSIHKNIDYLNKYDLKIVGETYLEINHCLLALPGTNLHDIKEVYSHWQALAQCEDNIQKVLPEANIREYFDTAGAARFIHDENDRTKACIASELAKDKYNLETLVNGFQDTKNNYTRFILVGKEYKKINPAENKNYKTSIIFSGKNIPGLLYNVLKSFATRNISLTKIESRPKPDDIWNYFFYIDFEGKYDDANCAEAIKEMQENVTMFKILGSYENGRN